MFALDEVVPWGRSFDEYRRMFALTRTGAHALADNKAMRERMWRGINISRIIESF